MITWIRTKAAPALARARHLIFPSRRRAAMLVLVEVTTFVLHLPMGVHVAVTVAAHVVVVAWP